MQAPWPKTHPYNHPYTGCPADAAAQPKQRLASHHLCVQSFHAVVPELVYKFAPSAGGSIERYTFLTMGCT